MALAKNIGERDRSITLAAATMITTLSFFVHPSQLNHIPADGTPPIQVRRRSSAAPGGRN